jgi:hypothetical protein
MRGSDRLLAAKDRYFWRSGESPKALVGYIYEIILIVPIVAIGGVLAARIVSGLTEDAEGGPSHGARNWTIRFAAILPFICIAWWILVGFSYVSGAHRDAVGQPYAPLVNGYGFSVNTAGEGLIGKLGSHRLVGSMDYPDREAFVQSVQIVDAAALGFSRTPYRNDRTGAPDQWYFLFDLKRQRDTRFPTLDALQVAAHARGLVLKLEPSTQVYERLTRRPDDWIATLLFAIPPIVLTGLLVSAIVRLRRLPPLPRRW